MNILFCCFSGPKFDFDNMYNNIPASLKQECLVRTKVEANPKELQRRREIVETRTPAQLAEIKGLSDLPIPATLERVIKGSGGPKAPSRRRSSSKAGLEEKRK